MHDGTGRYGGVMDMYNQMGARCTYSCYTGEWVCLEEME